MGRWTEEGRKEWIERRQRESVAWKAIHTLGSLRLAVLLLITIAIGCAVATVYESRFSTKIAKIYVYENPLFVLWLAVLCINLAAATLTRWPWQRKHVGFVITHAGIIILLIGAVVGRMTGFEAGVILHKGTPTNRLVQNETVLQVDNPADRAVYTMPLAADVRPPTAAKPRTVPLPGTDLKLRLSDYAEHLSATPVLAADLEGGPAVALEFVSAMMGQNVPVALASSPPEAATNDFFGRAQIELMNELPGRTAVAEESEPVAESQIVMMKHAPVVLSHVGAPTGVRLQLEKTDGSMMLLAMSPEGATESYAAEEMLNRPLKLGDASLTLTIRNYWPDMAMEDGIPISRSEEPNNPAVLVEIRGRQRASAGAGGKDGPLLELAVGPSGTLRYQLSRGGAVYAQGTASEGKSIPLGWADWQANVRQVLLKARMERRLSPDSNLKTAPPGILAALVSPEGAASEPMWLAAGEPRILTLNGKGVRIGFGLKTRQLPFAIELLNFEVPRDEGTDTPANFISTVRFHDPTNGVTLDAKAHMNHPASYPPGWWPAISGQGYKFSQASWDPDDLNQTTLQVLHDPGWPLKWIGSLLVCLGIAVMFYLSPRRRAANELVRAAQQEPQMRREEALSEK